MAWFAGSARDGGALTLTALKTGAPLYAVSNEMLQPAQFMLLRLLKAGIVPSRAVKLRAMLEMYCNVGACR